MKKVIFSLLVFVSVIEFTSCTNATDPAASYPPPGDSTLYEMYPKKVVKTGPDTTEAFYVINANKLKAASTYPFSEADYIEILSYPNRMEWDTTADGKYSDYFHPEIIKKGKLNFDTTRIKERVRLTSEQGNKLFGILYNNTCLMQQMSPCFDPRHSIIFYHKDKKAFAFIEMCLMCSTVRTSNLKNEPEITCFEKKKDLIQLFKSVGINFGLNGEDK